VQVVASKRVANPDQHRQPEHGMQMVPSDTVIDLLSCVVDEIRKANSA
jgi:hypothetical protein